MKVLIVNCFKNAESAEKFLKFIKTFIEQLTKPFIQDELEFIVRGRRDLSDFLIDYDEMQSESNSSAPDHNVEEQESFFDKLDFVIIDGDIQNFMPWHSDHDQLRLLIKNCIRSNKCLFGTHIVFNSLIYLKSIGLNKLTQKILVVNNNQKGDFALDNIQINKIKIQNKIQAESKGCSKHCQKQQRVPMILLALQGQLYQYDGDNHILIFYGDTGIVNRKAIQINHDYYGSQSVGHKAGFVIRENQANNITIFKAASTSSQTMQSVADKFMINKTFIIDYQWRTNKNESELSQLQIKTLLSCPNGGPQVIEHGNVVGNQFLRIHEYSREPDLYKMFCNYFISRIGKMQEQGFIHQKIRDTLINHTSSNFGASRKFSHQYSKSSQVYKNLLSTPLNTSAALSSSVLQPAAQSQTILDDTNQKKFLTVKFKDSQKSYKFGSPSKDDVSHCSTCHNESIQKITPSVGYKTSQSFIKTNPQLIQSAEALIENQYSSQPQKIYAQSPYGNRIQTSYLQNRIKSQNTSKLMNSTLSKQQQHYNSLMQKPPIKLSKNIWTPSKGEKIVFSEETSQHKKVESFVTIHQHASYEDDNRVEIANMKMTIAKRLLKIPRKIKQVKIIYQVPRKIA